MTVCNIYEKMLQDPQNRTSSSGMVKQPIPYDELGMSNPDHPEFLSQEDQAMMAAADKGMIQRAHGPVEPLTQASTNHTPITATNISEARIQNLEKEIAELKDLMTQIMKTHLKLLKQEN